jgi:mannobiose 2-epimerase
MKRPNFPFASLMSAFGKRPATKAPARPATAAEYRRIADEVDANLQHHILDKFFPATADRQAGGFFENHSANWSREPGREKHIVYQSRLTWTSAQAASRFGANAELYREMTRHGAAFLAGKMWGKTSGGFHWCIDSAGQPANASKQMYGHAFGIYALTASYQATHDQAALDLAKKAFQWLEDRAHDNEQLGYFESIGADGKPSGDNVVGARAHQKSMNTSIHIVEALASLYRVWPDPLVKTRVQEMLDIFHDRIYSPQGYLTQFFERDWQRTTSPDSFGHDVEVGFLLVEAAAAIGKGDDARNWNAARSLVDHAMQYGWDHKRGGLYDTGTMNAKGAVTGGLRTDKIWWVQAEHLNALLLQHEHVGNETPKYWDAFLKQWDWITQSQIDHKNGGWWPLVRANGTPISRLKTDLWTECYHQARAMLTVSHRLRKLATDQACDHKKFKEVGKPL